VIQGDFHRNVDVTQSRCRSTRHPVPTSSIPSLIHRFISRFADSASAASLVGAYARRHPSWTGWSPLFPLSRRNDRHLACNRCGFAAPGRRLFIDSAVLPASCMFVIAWANTCALHACVRACVRACVHAVARGYRRLSARLGFLERRGIYLVWYIANRFDDCYFVAVRRRYLCAYESDSSVAKWFLSVSALG